MLMDPFCEHSTEEPQTYKKCNSGSKYFMLIMCEQNKLKLSVDMML